VPTNLSLVPAQPGPEPASESPLMKAADHFINNKRLAGRSGFTLNLYYRAIRYLDEWLAENQPGHSRDIADITRGDVNAFIEDYRSNHAPSSTETNRGYLSTFFRWAIRSDYGIETNPMEAVPTITVPQTEPHIVTDEEFEAMVRTTESKRPSFTDRRDKAIILLLESSAARRGEVASAKLADLNLRDNTLQIMGKGSKPGELVFDDRAADSLHHYVRARASHPHARRPELFLRPSGAMTPISIYEAIKRRAAQAGYPDVSTHAFRHRWAHRAKLEGVLSEEQIMTLGRWESAIYLRRYGRASKSARAKDAYLRWKRGQS
jgi:site-specific recombinase XerD